MLRIFRKQKVYKVYVDGKWIPELRVEARDSSKGKWYEISPDTPDAAQILATLPLTTDSIPEYLPHLHVRREDGLDSPAWLPSIQVSRLDSRCIVTAILTFPPETPGLFENAGAFVAALGNIPELGIHSVDVSTSLEVDARAQLLFEVSTFAEGVARTTELLRPAFAVLGREHAPSIDALFDFPAPVRSACEQYLLHFADFLRDLGVDTSVTLTEIANHVLFKVTPLDRFDALENIQTALDAYLHLPGAIVVGDPDGPSDRIMAYKLRANISHLQAQLDLARAQNEAMRAHLQAQDMMIELLHHRRLGPGIQNRTSEGDSETLARYVSVTDVEKAGVKIHLAALLRDLKKLFGKRSV